VGARASVRGGRAGARARWYHPVNPARSPTPATGFTGRYQRVTLRILAARVWGVTGA